MDYYQILNIGKNASQDEIKKAFRKLASIHHPDKGGDTINFQKIEQAYRVLTDIDKRQEYDQLNNNLFKDFVPNKDNNFQDFFQFIFNQQKFNHKHHPQIYRTKLSVTLEDVYLGKSLIIKLQTPNGQKIVQVTLPKGIHQQVKVENLNDNTLLIIDIEIIKHLKFDVRGNDLLTNYPISVLDLITGSSQMFNTISGKQVEVTIPPLTQPYMELKLLGEGLPIVNSTMYGDQILLLKPFIPANISTDVINSIKKYKEQQ